MSLLPAGELIGTIAYLAPEQRFSSKKVNGRADVYALGAILYEMLMGFPPLGNFPKPVDVNPDFPESLQSVLVKCLAPNPEERFENAGRLQLELGTLSNVPMPGVRRPNAVAHAGEETLRYGRVLSLCLRLTPIGLNPGLAFCATAALAND